MCNMLTLVYIFYQKFDASLQIKKIYISFTYS